MLGGAREATPRGERAGGGATPGGCEAVGVAASGSRPNS